MVIDKIKKRIENNSEEDKEGQQEHRSDIPVGNG